MSIPAVVWVFEHSEEKLGNRLVLLALAEFAHDDGSDSYPSIDTLMRRTRLSERQVRYCLRALEQSGAIVNEGVSAKRTTKYRVVLSEGAISAPGQSLQGAKSYREGGNGLPPILKEPLREREANASLSRRTPKTRPRDEVWDALEALFGPVFSKTNGHAKRNKATVDLKRMGATADAIRLAAKRWPATFNGATLTDVALATHYPQLHRPDAERAARAAPCPECGIGQGRHADDCPLASEIARSPS